eukprot:1181011-Prorocentrum_minimum.AAC.1
MACETAPKLYRPYCSFSLRRRCETRGARTCCGEPRLISGEGRPSSSLASACSDCIRCRSTPLCPSSTCAGRQRPHPELTSNGVENQRAQAAEAKAEQVEKNGGTVEQWRAGARIGLGVRIGVEHNCRAGKYFYVCDSGKSSATQMALSIIQISDATRNRSLSHCWVSYFWVFTLHLGCCYYRWVEADAAQAQAGEDARESHLHSHVLPRAPVPQPRRQRLRRHRRRPQVLPQLKQRGGGGTTTLATTQRGAGGDEVVGRPVGVAHPCHHVWVDRVRLMQGHLRASKP